MKRINNRKEKNIMRIAEVYVGTIKTTGNHGIFKIKDCIPYEQFSTGSTGVLQLFEPNNFNSIEVCFMNNTLKKLKDNDSVCFDLIYEEGENPFGESQINHIEVRNCKNDVAVLTEICKRDRRISNMIEKNILLNQTFGINLIDSQKEILLADVSYVTTETYSACCEVSERQGEFSIEDICKLIPYSKEEIKESLNILYDFGYLNFSRYRQRNKQQVAFYKFQPSILKNQRVKYSGIDRVITAGELFNSNKQESNAYVLAKHVDIDGSETQVENDKN